MVSSAKNLLCPRGPDFPGETLRALKEKEEKEFGEFRTRRFVLEVWNSEPKIEVH